MSCGADGSPRTARPLPRPWLLTPALAGLWLGTACPGRVRGARPGSGRTAAVQGCRRWSAALPLTVPVPSGRFAGFAEAAASAGMSIAGSGFEFRSRFDDMLRGASGLGVNGQGIVGGIHRSVLPTKADTPDGLSGLARDAAVSSRISRYRAVAIIGFAGASPRASRTRRPRCLGGRVAPVLLR